MKDRELSPYHKIVELKRELEEQLRLNGMGSEREARLMARVAELERENATLRKALDKAIVLLRRWNRNDVSDDVVIDTRKVICAVLKEAQP